MPNEARIAIIDDDEAMRVALVGLVRSYGYEARGFAGGEDFLAAAALQDFDCIVTDIQMPGMSGIELKQALEARKSCVPVIMITARTDEGIETRVLATGARCLLRKPIVPGALLDHIAGALTD